MTAILNPYLTFPGNAAEAMAFYARVFGGTVNAMTFGEMDAAPPEFADKVMHAQLETDRGFTLMAADPPPGMEVQPGNNIAISLSGDDGDVLRSYWEQLSGSGSVQVPLEKQMWGDTFGMCSDGFGITWLVNISDPA